MAGEYFERFCEILDDNTILKKSTAIGVMVDFKYCINEIKSEVLKELQSKGDFKNDYLDFLINEVEKQAYIKEANINYIQKYLDQYSITIEEIIDMKFMSNPIAAKIDRHYNDMIPFSHEKDEAFLIQSDFLNFFCKYYADELINFLNSRKTFSNTIQKENTATKKPFKVEYLNIFCEGVSNERKVKETCFDYLYENITHFETYLITEIKENLLLLDKEKREDYIDYVIDVLNNTPFAEKGKFNIDKWITKYSLDIREFPNFNNKEVSHWLERYYNGYIEAPHERDFILDIQIDFYCYACMIEVNKVIDFLESKRNIQKVTSDTKTEKTSLDIFLDNLKSIDILYGSHFMFCYDINIKKLVDKIIVDIQEEIFKMPENKINLYLSLLENKIKLCDIVHEVNFNIDKWKEYYNFKLEDFPNFKDKDLVEILSIHLTENNLDFIEKVKAEEIQTDFYKYGCYIEANRLLSFIATLKNETASNEQQTLSTKTTFPLNSIFRNEVAQNTFYELVKYLEIDTNNITKRGNQAKFSGIWSCSDSNKYFFKDFTELKEYISFVNEKYSTKYNGRTFSDGSNYFKLIKDWLN